MIKIGLIGVGKMGLSHLAILGSHPQVNVVGVADTSDIINDVLEKYTSFKTYKNYITMIENEKPEGVIVSVPTKFHAPIVTELLKRKIHVFVEKPFCLNTKEGQEILALANKMKTINQVGYHNHFVGTFREVKDLIKKGYLGTITHFSGEAYGPVVIKNQKNNWRSDPNEGGGCLMDYASHVIDLINNIIDPIEVIHGSILKKIHSVKVDDAVYALIETKNKISGVLSVNWSDETFRKMYTSITIIGTNGKIIADATEIKVYFKTNNYPPNYTKGWNIKNITTLTENSNFYLRGEEYSNQIDHFINTIIGTTKNDINTFETAYFTDQVIDKIKNKHYEKINIRG